MRETLLHLFNETELSGVIAARLIIVASKNSEMSKLGYETEPSEFSYEQWMSLADQVLNSVD